MVEGELKMALKNWRKIRGSPAFELKRNPNISIEIYHEIQKPQIDRWRVDYGSRWNGGTKLYKQKSSALKFAKTYMGGTK